MIGPGRLLVLALIDPHAGLGAYEQVAGRAGLQLDRVCHLHHARAEGEDDADDEGEPWVDEPVPREITRCGECPILFGAVAVGQPCQGYPGGSDCGRGLVCAGLPDGQCVDPCVPMPAGARCYIYETGCAPGWSCDPWQGRCSAAQGDFVSSGRRWVQIVSARMTWPSAVGWMPSAWFSFTSPATPASTKGIRGTP